MIDIIPVNAGKIEKDLALYGQRAEREYGEAVQIAGQRYRDFVKQMQAVSAPRDGYSARGIPVASGNLRRSIRSRKISNLAAGVGIGKPAEKYGHVIHDGSRRYSKVRARPFFQWALDMGALKLIDDTILAVMKRFP